MVFRFWGFFNSISSFSICFYLFLSWFWAVLSHFSLDSLDLRFLHSDNAKTLTECLSSYGVKSLFLGLQSSLKEPSLSSSFKIWRGLWYLFLGAWLCWEGDRALYLDVKRENTSSFEGLTVWTEWGLLWIDLKLSFERFDFIDFKNLHLLSWIEDSYKWTTSFIFLEIGFLFLCFQKWSTSDLSDSDPKRGKSLRLIRFKAKCFEKFVKSSLL